MLRPITLLPRRYASTASEQLWAEALKEEQQQKKRSTPTLPSYPNWTGDESIEDVVLRMLVDKYKPLRTGTIKTADEKLKAGTEDTSSAHKPWLTTFRAPSHTTSVRYMRLPPPVQPAKLSPGIPVHPDDTRTRIIEREKRRKAVYAGRLTNARESSLDYRIGKHHATPVDDARGTHRPNPVSIKGWTSLVEERIERARSEGLFRTIKGRGKPLVRDNEQGNPFIPREEFLMNRIVQRQGAAPPWVEFQAELDTAITSFRTTLRTTFTRRAIRTLTLSVAFTPSSVTSSRIKDPAWEARERAYHEEAIRQINALVRRYNGVAPYAVRRAYLTREAELESMYEACGGDILEGIARREEGSADVVEPGVDAVGRERGGGDDGGEVQSSGFVLGAVWRRWLAKFVGG